MSRNKTASTRPEVARTSKESTGKVLEICHWPSTARWQAKEADVSNEIPKTNLRDVSLPTRVGNLDQTPSPQVSITSSQFSESDDQSSIPNESDGNTCMPHSPKFIASEEREPIIEKPGGILKLLLRLENARLEGESILVGVVIHSQCLEFFFSSARDMAICVGIGLPEAKVVLNDDLSINIEETVAGESELKDSSWGAVPNDSNSHLVMKAKWGAKGMCRDDHAETSQSRSIETLSKQCGVHFDGSTPQYIDETYDPREVSRPLLYDMALTILAAGNVGHNVADKESSGQGSTSRQGDTQRSIANKLHQNLGGLLNRGGGGGDGDGDGDNFNAIVDDEPPVVLKVTVYPGIQREIYNTQSSRPRGLERASIAPKLIFEFRKNRRRKRIFVRIQTSLELVSRKHMRQQPHVFGWYHTDIDMFFRCQAAQGAMLDQGSWTILKDEAASHKSTTTRSVVSSTEDAHATGFQASLNASSVFMPCAIQATASGNMSSAQSQATSTGGSDEITRESVCHGFLYQDLSTTRDPAGVHFFLSYPLENVNIWDHKELLQGQGLFSTIVPTIEGTWIPLDENLESPYVFYASQVLKFHKREEGGAEEKHHFDQAYMLNFCVNHAMSHLRSQNDDDIEIHGHQSVPHVLIVKDTCID